MSLLTTLLRERAPEMTDAALIAAMIDVEAALAQVQGQLGVIPAEAGRVLAAKLSGLRLEPEQLREGMASAGVPVPALVSALRGQLPKDAGIYLHWGATSQDIQDTALVLCLRAYLTRLNAKLRDLGDALAASAEAERQTPVMAHTRFQQAVPTVLGLRYASWLAPLIRHRQRLEQVRPRLLLLQFGGAAGNLSALGEHGMAVARALAKELSLGLPAMPWHNQRDGLFELAAILAGLAGLFGKMGQDILLASQNEVGEMREADGGGSSTMPNKSNPVRSEALVTIARLAGGQVASMQSALLHAQERDGTAWALEWAVLPDLLDGVSRASEHAMELVQTCVVERDVMQSAIQDESGFGLAEAASFILSRDLPRDEAQALVKAAISDAKAEGIGLMAALKARRGGLLDETAVMTLATTLPAAQEMIDAVVLQWRQTREPVDE